MGGDSLFDGFLQPREVQLPGEAVKERDVVDGCIRMGQALHEYAALRLRQGIELLQSAGFLIILYCTCLPGILPGEDFPSVLTGKTAPCLTVSGRRAGSRPAGSVIPSEVLFLFLSHPVHTGSPFAILHQMPRTSPGQHALSQLFFVPDLLFENNFCSWNMIDACPYAEVLNNRSGSALRALRVLRTISTYSINMLRIIPRNLVKWYN